MEKFTKDSNYKLMVAHATAHGINHNGVNKAKLSEELNKKVEEIGEEAYTEVINAAEAASKQPENLPTPVVQETSTTPAATKAPKWFEAQGFAYKEGDVVLIQGHKIKGLNGRFAMVNKPSAKKEAVKAFLYEPKTGALQATNITLDYDNCVASGLAQDEVVAKILQEQADKAKAKEDIKAAKDAEKAAKKAEKEAEKNARIAKANEAKQATATTATA